MDKFQLNERDICTKFIVPALQQAGWLQHQFREEVKLTDGRVVVRGVAAERIYWPILNLDIKSPNAPEEETHDPDVQNQLKSELAAALAHHFTDAEALDA